MKLTQLQQSGVIIESNSGYKLAIDIVSYTPIDSLSGLSIDAMLVSHLHGDHFSIEHLKKISPKRLYLSQECADLLKNDKISSEVIIVKIGDIINIDRIKIEFFESDHGPNVKIRPVENFGFFIEVDEEKIYFAGDMYSPSGIDVTSLEVDYALMPIGGFYTFGPNEALDFTKQFKKIKKIIPMHFEYNPDAREEWNNILD